MAALFIIGKMWKQHKCPPTDECINKCKSIQEKVFSKRKDCCHKDVLWPYYPQMLLQRPQEMSRIGTYVGMGSWWPLVWGRGDRKMESQHWREEGFVDSGACPTVNILKYLFNFRIFKKYVYYSSANIQNFFLLELPHKNL